jgi:hypothetical protein
VQIRGIHGEHSETADHVYDISNRRRLGISELDLVQDMYSGVKAMISKELELAKQNAPAAAPAETTVCGAHLGKPEDLIGFPEFPPGTKSTLSRYLTKDIWNKFKDQKDSFGVSFKQCIFSGCQNVDSGVGVYSGSKDCYEKFAEFFDKVVEDYHGIKQHTNEGAMDPKELNAPEFPADEAAMIVSTRIRVGRNLDEYPLGPGITDAQRNEMEGKISGALKNFTGDLEGTYYPLNKMTAAQQQQLIDDHFLFKEGDRYLQACGLNRDWPNGRGIFHNNDKTFLVWVNEEDQLRIISMQKGANIGEVFGRLCRAANQIE